MSAALATDCGQMEARIDSSNGAVYAPVKVTTTGRTITRTPWGVWGTKARIEFLAAPGIEGSVVSGWVL
jgi:hypothetical protein